MLRSTLKNGLKVLFERKKSKSIVLAIQVNVGANNESDSIRGISHFIEHMLFEGTEKRTSLEIANEIERLGGEINAFTSHDRTVYYIAVPQKNFSIGMDVLADIIQNPKFDNAAIEKERKVILDEVNLTQDDPKFYQFIFFLKNLYKSNPVRHPLYGYKETIESMSREDLLGYYSKYYAPNNMTLSIIGNVKYDVSLLESLFCKLQPKNVPGTAFQEEPSASSQETFVETRNIFQSYLVLGYKAPLRSDDDSYAADVIRAVLARGQSSRLFNELRTKRGLCYFVGGTNESSKDYGYFAIYVGTDKGNIEEVTNIIKNEINSLKKISKSDLKEAKTFIEGSFLLDNDDPKKLAETLLFWNSIDENFEIKSYIKKIRKVGKKDVASVLKKYFNENFNVSIIQQE